MAVAYTQPTVPNYSHVTGTGVYMQPPGGFEPAIDFAGFQLGEGALISVRQQLEANFAMERISFNADHFEASGFTVLGIEEVTIDDRPGLLATLESNGRARIYELLFGDASFVVNVSALYPIEQEGLGRAIKSALLGVKFELETGPYDDTFFSLDDSTTKLQFADFANDAWIFSEDGSIKVPKGHPVLIVRALELDQVESPRLICHELFAESRSFGLVNIENIRSRRSEIDGRPAFELMGKGEQLSGGTGFLYVSAVGTGRQFVLFQAVIENPHFDPNSIRELIKTLKFTD